MDFVNEELAGWVRDFEEMIQGGSAPTKVFSSLLQLGVVNPDSCGCDAVDIKGVILLELHLKHRVYNREVWQIVAASPGLISKLRKVAQRDLRGPNPKNLGEEYGKIALKSHSRNLLDHFLKVSSPAWA